MGAHFFIYCKSTCAAGSQSQHGCRAGATLVWCLLQKLGWNPAKSKQPVIPLPQHPPASNAAGSAGLWLAQCVCKQPLLSRLYSICRGPAEEINISTMVWGTLQQTPNILSETELPPQEEVTETGVNFRVYKLYKVLLLLILFII